MKAIPCSWAFWVGLSLAAGTVRAQFPGDVYLEAPANVVATGGEVTLRVKTFTGTRRFGAVHFDLVFDPAVLQFVSAGTPAPSELLVSAHAKGGRLAVVVSNAKGVDRPFGVVTLAEVRLRAIGQPLATSVLDLTAFRMIALDGADMPTRAFDGSVLVTSAGPGPSRESAGGAVSLPRPSTIEPASPLVATQAEQAAAMAMGRPGQMVQLWRAVPHGGGIAGCPVHVMIGPTAASGELAEKPRSDR